MNPDLTGNLLRSTVAKTADGLMSGMISVQRAYPVQRQALVEQVIRGLQERLAGGEFAAGTRLPPEAELMAQFGVGRSTIREAVRALAHTGLIEVRQGDGTYVLASPENAEPLARRLKRARAAEVYEVRRALELGIARLAAQRRDAADLVHLRHLLAQRGARTDAGDDAAFLDADVEFHVAVAEATKNTVLTELYRTFAVVLREALAEVVLLPGREHRTALHEALVEAIAQQDPDAAYEITMQHLDGTAGLLQSRQAEP